MFVAVDGGSVGYQIGGSSTDLVMLFMNDHALRSLLGDKLKLGADVSVAAGPVGRRATAATDLRLNAEILSYSRSKGLFAGVSLNGADAGGQKRRQFNVRAQCRPAPDLHGSIPVPPSASGLLHELDSYSTVASNK